MFSETQYYESYIFSPLYILLVVYELVKGVFDGWGGHMEEHMESGYEKIREARDTLRSCC